MEPDEASRSSVRRWWYAGGAVAMTALALASVLAGRSWSLLVNVAVGVVMLSSFGYVRTKARPPTRRSTPSHLSKLDDRLMARFSRPRRRPLTRLERWLQQLDEAYAPEPYRRDQHD